MITTPIMCCSPRWGSHDRILYLLFCDLFRILRLMFLCQFFVVFADSCHVTNPIPKRDMLTCRLFRIRILYLILFCDLFLILLLILFRCQFFVPNLIKLPIRSLPQYRSKDLFRTIASPPMRGRGLDLILISGPVVILFPILQFRLFVPILPQLP